MQLAFGGAFTGYFDVVQSFVVEPGRASTVTVAVAVEPRVTVMLPEDVRRCWIQAGGDSLGDIESGQPTAVPAGRPLVFFAATPTADHLLRRPAAEDGMVVDLTRPETIVHRRPPPATGRVLVAVTGATAAAPGELHALSPGQDVTVDTLDQPGRYRVEGPVGVPFLLRYATTGLRVVLSGGVERERALRPEPLAQLVIESELPCTPLGLEELDLTALHAGPLQFVLGFADGRRIGVALELAPGVKRTLRIGRAR